VEDLISEESTTKVTWPHNNEYSCCWSQSKWTGVFKVLYRNISVLQYLLLMESDFRI
jgi:hypothetical protein